MSLPAGPFAVILADPPWRFVTFDRKKSVPSRTAEDPYETMTMDELLALGVEQVAAKDCVLLMWVVDAHLEQGIALGQAWGFQYKTIAFIWDKAQMGMGYWTRKEGEVCLLFTRGKPQRQGRGVRQFLRARRREHSRKPDEQYPAIETLLNGPYLEMFARSTRPGWAAWGNQVTKFVSEDIRRRLGVQLPVIDLDTLISDLIGLPADVSELI